jgi:hypothetical protein
MPRLGVKINYICYWSDAFVNPEVERTQVPVRFDPFDAGVAYAFIKGRWVRCISEHHAHFAGRSEREMMLATVELRRRNRRHTQQLAVTARRLADFLASLEAEEILLEQRLRDAEAKDVLAIIEGDRVYESRRTRSLPEMASDEEKGEAGEAGGQFPGNAIPRSDTLAIYEDY